jgi:hypothetical protein
VAATAGASGGAAHDPFAFLSPEVVVTQAERTLLDGGETIVKVLPGRDGYLALTAIVRIDAPAGRVADLFADVEALQRGRYVPELGRFSNPPQLDDLRGLTLDGGDLEDLRGCRPASCAVKLSDREIALLPRTSDRMSLDAAFRQILLARAAHYGERGDDCAQPYNDHKTPVSPQAAFAAVLQRLPLFARHYGDYAAYLTAFPYAPATPVERSFLYWSKETLGLKPIITITHFSVLGAAGPRLPEALMVSKQVYASHYRNASLSMTAVVADRSSRFLVYVNRAQIDGFKGLLGGLVRRLVERRVLSEAPGVLSDLRRRLDAPAAAPTRP